jgi:hypothetical protein
MQNTIEQLKENISITLSKLDQEELLKVYQLTSQLLGERLSREVSGKLKNGKISNEMLNEAIKQHRRKYPYT